MSMPTSEAILCDAGLLIAILTCTELLQQSPAQQLWTPIACFVEASFVLQKRIEYTAVEKLWEMWEANHLQILVPPFENLARIGALMRQYQDIGIDFADASIVVAAEETGIRKVLTVDTRFYAYRLKDGSALEVLLVRKRP